MHHHVHHEVVVLSIHESKVAPESQVNLVDSLERKLPIDQNLELLDLAGQVV